MRMYHLMYYQYEIIQGADRKMMEKIPEAAFREAIANALIHRVWDVDSHIRVSMLDDRIEVVSPGGLPIGITAEEYLSGKLSVLRNRNLANVFYRLGFVEIFGTGVTRIKQLYAESLIKPDFEVSENTIKIVLPVFEANDNLTEDEKVIYKFLSKTMLKPISEIAPYVPFGKSKTTQLLKAMGEKGVVEVEGKGRGTKYNTANGANSSAQVYSISETAKLNHLRPYYYFRYILTELPKHCDEKGNIDPAELDYLMPWSESLPEECRKPRRS